MMDATNIVLLLMMLMLMLMLMLNCLYKKQVDTGIIDMLIKFDNMVVEELVMSDHPPIDIV
jgi:hypothetical protein